MTVLVMSGQANQWPTMPTAATRTPVSNRERPATSPRRRSGDAHRIRLGCHEAALRAPTTVALRGARFAHGNARSSLSQGELRPDVRPRVYRDLAHDAQDGWVRNREPDAPL